MNAEKAYENLFRERLAAGSYAFVTVNFDLRTVHRALAAERPDRESSRALTDLYLASLRAGPKHLLDKNNYFWNEFFLRLNTRVLGTSRSKKGEALEVVGTFENPGSDYDPNATELHLHCYVRIPSERTFYDVRTGFFECWQRFVMPLKKNLHPLANDPIKIVEWISEGRDGYTAKQFKNWEVARSRFYAPTLSRKRRKNESTT